MNEPIDVVVTWVDGNDKAHIQKLNDYFHHQGIVRPDNVEPTRFNQCGEINYCIRSIFRFAPWIRTIYVITDAQTPSIINQLRGTQYEHKVKIIDHRDVFAGYEHQLPTFNSLAIESVLWRIEGLSDRFIYFNDDCFLTQPVSFHDFFRDDKLVFRGTWKVQSDKKLKNYYHKMINLLKNKSSTSSVNNEHRTLQENSAKQTGWDKHFFHLPHIPFPIRKKTLSSFFQKYPEILEENLSHPFRNHAQTWSISLAHHLEIKQGDVVFDHSLKAVTINGAFHSLTKIESRLAHAQTKKTAFICMQSIDSANDATQATLFKWLDQQILLREA